MGGRKGIRSVKNEWWDAGVVVSGARCRFGPANANATHSLLLQEIQIDFGFTFLAPAHPGGPGQKTIKESHKIVMVVVVVVVVGVFLIQSSDL